MSQSDDELCRRDRRRRQNREAARRCRQRKRNVSVNLLKEYQELQSANTQLQHEVRVLERQRQNLNSFLDDHVSCCTRSSLSDLQRPDHSRLQTANTSDFSDHDDWTSCISKTTANTRERPLVGAATGETTFGDEGTSFDSQRRLRVMELRQTGVVCEGNSTRLPAEFGTKSEQLGTWPRARLS